MKRKALIGDVDLLGKVKYSKTLLKTFPYTGKISLEITYTFNSFSSICPLLKNADFGIIDVRYVPKKLILETESIKAYLYSFRNYACFQEEIVALMARDIFEAIKPVKIEVTGEFRDGVLVKALKGRGRF